jgi:hypothetical protein
MIFKWQDLTVSEVMQPNFSFAISSHRTVATITLRGKENGSKSSITSLGILFK